MDTSNKFNVKYSDAPHHGREIVTFAAHVPKVISPDDALNLAAWLVKSVPDGAHKFSRLASVVMGGAKNPTLDITVCLPNRSPFGVSMELPEKVLEMAKTEERQAELFQLYFQPAIAQLSEEAHPREASTGIANRAQTMADDFGKAVDAAAKKSSEQGPKGTVQ